MLGTINNVFYLLLLKKEIEHPKNENSKRN